MVANSQIKGKPYYKMYILWMNCQKFLLLRLIQGLLSSTYQRSSLYDKRVPKVCTECDRHEMTRVQGRSLSGSSNYAITSFNKIM